MQRHNHPPPAPPGGGENQREANLNPNIRLLALDMDGTLFGEDLHISTPVKAAVRAAADCGVLICIASGRVAEEGLRVLADIDLDPACVAPIICYQGALVYDPQRGPLLTFTLDPAIAEAIIEYTRSIGLGVNLHTAAATYTERPREADRFYAEVSNLAPILVPDLVAVVREQGLQPLKLVMVTDGMAQTNELVDALNHKYDGRVVAARSYPLFCEVTDPLANKGAALTYLADQLGIPLAQTMAVGDSPNDIPMLRVTGISVAMGHASAEVKAAARYATGTLAADGAASAIVRFILERVGS